MSLQWIKFGMDTASAQWHFHMDLLELWRAELANISLACYVIADSGDTETLAKQLDYYKQVIRLFAFDTGFDPIVAIYDGNIRQNRALYSFFSQDPVYLKVSAAYYAAALKDVNEQFTEQFIGNLFTIWGLIIPEWIAGALTVMPKEVFDSAANHKLMEKGVNLKSASQFIQWCSHAYSVALKNYSPFVASPALWRVYNPMIGAYWATLVSNILCYQALLLTAFGGKIKPFIETQKTRITINGELYQESRLTGDGVICTQVPRSALTKINNAICFDTYGLKSCLAQSPFYTKYYCDFDYMTETVKVPNLNNCDDLDLSTPLYAAGIPHYWDSAIDLGFSFYNPNEVPFKFSMDVNWTEIYGREPYIDGVGIRAGNIHVFYIQDSGFTPGRIEYGVEGAKYGYIFLAVPCRYWIDRYMEVWVSNITITDITEDDTELGIGHWHEPPYSSLCPGWEDEI